VELLSTPTEEGQNAVQCSFATLQILVRSGKRSVNASHIQTSSRGGDKPRDCVRENLTEKL
jgi:hypothetical protein